MKQNFQLYIALVTVEIVIGEAASLKEKRRITKSIKDRLRARYNASIAEIGYLDKWQRAALGISVIGNNKQKVKQDVASMEGLLTDYTDVSVSHFNTEWL